jgi:DNA adenine methylase
MIEQNWSDPNFHLLTREHFYHVGSTEDLRHPMIEALITNFAAEPPRWENKEAEQLAFLEHPVKAYSA